MQAPGVQLDPQLLGALADRRLPGRFAGLRLPTGKHEQIGAALADGEDPALRIADDDGADGDWIGHAAPCSGARPSTADRVRDGRRSYRRPRPSPRPTPRASL